MNSHEPRPHLRRILAALALAALVLLTRPDGQPIWVAPSQVVSVTRPAPGEYPPSAATEIVTLNGVVAVREQPADVARLLQVTQ